MALYRATNGSQWLHQTGWLSNARLDNWFGVYVDSTVHSYLTYPPLGINEIVCTRCDALNPGVTFCEECGAELTAKSSRVLFTGLVVGLNLENNRLSGPIPAELGQMTSLQYLDLSRNQLSGPIPPGLNQMTSLWKRIARVKQKRKRRERRDYFLWKMSKLKNSKPQA